MFRADATTQDRGGNCATSSTPIHYHARFGVRSMNYATRC